MGQRPIEDVVAAAFAARGIEPLFIRPDGRPVWPIMGGSGEGEDSVDSGTDGDEGDGDEETGDEKPKTKSADPKVKELSDENSRRRNENKNLRAELDAKAAKLKEYEDADKTETDKLTGERDELKQKSEKLAETNYRLSLQVAFLQNNTHDWHNPKAALRLLDLDGVEIDDEGEVKGLDDAIKKLATENPYLLKDKAGKTDDEESGAPPASGQPVSKKAEKQRTALEQKYRLGR